MTCGRQPHQLELVRVLDHAAAGGDRRAAHDRSVPGAACATPSLKTNSYRLLDAEPPGRDAAIAQSLRDALVRALVLLPGPHVGGAAERAGAICSRARSSSNAGQTTNGSPFAGNARIANSRSLSPHWMPLKYTSEVPPVSRTASILLVRHQPPRLLDAPAPLRGGDRFGEVPHRLQSGE